MNLEMDPSTVKASDEASSLPKTLNPEQRNQLSWSPGETQRRGTS